MPMEPNQTQEVTMVATSRDMASALPIGPEDAFPEVFATSRMVALMEIAAARLMAGRLQPGELSVGVGVNIKHLAATPNHQTVRAEATFTGMAGKLYHFKVAAYDKAGKIGEGEHTRAIVAEQRLLAGAAKRFETSQP